TLDAEKTGLEHQLITRQYRLAEAQLVGADEVVKRAVGRLHIEHLETEDTGRLSHGLNNQHTRHDRVLGKVAIEERLVDADILVGANGLAFHVQLGNAIHQQEWVAVRQVFANLVDVHHVHKAFTENGGAPEARSGI